jgi:hypothetical protein
MASPHRWPLTAFRDFGLNVFGFLLLGLPLAVGLLAGCATAVPRPALPAGGPVPTACERSALMTGQAPDVTSPEAAAENLRWGALAPESCPEPGRLDESPPGTRR